MQRSATLVSEVEPKTWSFFDDILRAFITETNKFENVFGKIRDEERVLRVKKLMLESLLNLRFCGTTMSYNELLVASENIIIDKVATVSTPRNRKIDTSAPMDIGLPPANRGSRVASCLQRNRQRKFKFWRGFKLE